MRQPFAYFEFDTQNRNAPRGPHKGRGRTHRARSGRTSVSATLSNIAGRANPAGELDCCASPGAPGNRLKSSVAEAETRTRCGLPPTTRARWCATRATPRNPDTPVRTESSAHPPVDPARVARGDASSGREFREWPGACRASKFVARGAACATARATSRLVVMVSPKSKTQSKVCSVA